MTLEDIYQAIMGLREESKRDSHKAHQAIRNLQGSVKKLSKYCSINFNWLAEFKVRTEVIEATQMTTVKRTEAHTVQFSGNWRSLKTSKGIVIYVFWVFLKGQKRMTSEHLQ